MIRKPSRKGTASEEHSRRHRILVSARDCLLARGYGGTTVDDICRAAGVTKGAFFHHFSSKEAMAAEVLERFIEGVFAPMSFSRDPRVQEDPLRRLSSMCDLIVSAYESLPGQELPGCLMGLLTLELSEVNDRFREICDRAFRTLGEAIERELHHALEFHGVNLVGFDVRAKVMAEGVVSSFQGALILARASSDSSKLRSVLEGQLWLIEQVILGDGRSGLSRNKKRTKRKPNT